MLHYDQNKLSNLLQIQNISLKLMKVDELKKINK